MTLRMGLHAPTSGASDAFKQAAANLQASVFTWMALVMKDGSTAPHRPEDARSFPEGTHILRIPTPAPAETPADWMNRVVPLLDVWTSSGIPPGALIVQPGNEPDWPGVDLPVAWGVDAWLGAAHGYRDALKARYPNLPLLAPPLTCARTNALTFDYVQPYEGVAVHCYWSKGNPGWRQGKDGGQAWTCALFGKPIYVTEVGSNPQDAGEIVAWAGEIDSPLVFAATLFIADSAASWPEYNVTPQLAADVRAGLSVQPNPPPPPPPPPPQGYTRDTQPMHTGAAYQSDAWLVAMRGRNPNEADRIVAAYGSCAAALGYDGNLMIAQGWVETAGFTSSRWVNAHNAAGIGIYSDGTPDVQFGTVERGIQAQAGLLSDYFGDGRDPWGVLAEYGFGFATPLGKTKLSDMDGVWAADTGYSAAIVAVANSVTEGIVSPVNPASPPRYQFVTPVDCPIVQGSMGTFSHGGKSPGFYAIDYGCPMGTPIRAVADGTVIYNAFNHPREGQTGHTICLSHDGGYESRYCHLSEYDTPVGVAVTQGQIVAHSGAPDFPTVGANGYGAGAHLHFSISLNNVWVKVEDLTAAGLMGPWDGTPVKEIDVLVEGHLDPAMIERLWYGAATKAARKRMAYNPQSGIGQRWKKELMDGHPLGAVQSGEETDAASGRIVQYYTNGAITFVIATGETFVN